MSYTRTTYQLVHNGELLLVLDAALTPPFTIGENVELHNDETREAPECFMVATLSRTIPYHRLVTTGKGVEWVALAGQVVTVHLERRWAVAEKEA
jgi:hypothetical protein